MSRKKLIKQLKNKNPALNQSELENIIDIFSKNILNALKKGASVEIRGLGRWYIKKLKEKNIGILITDHNVRETLKIVDKVYIVNEGAIFYEGDPISAVKDEKIKKFYLGSNFQL